MTTVKDVINSLSNNSCSTDAVKGLSLQIIAEMNRLIPNVLIRFDDLNVSLSSSVNPFLQPLAKEALRRAINAKGTTLRINSAYRTIAQQFILWSWFKRGKQCGIKLAAAPGLSNHEDGLAIDIPDFDNWRSTLNAQGWQWLGASDPVHFSFRSRQVRDDIGAIGLKAFQTLWNKNNPDDQIAVDGLFGPNTASRLEKSPANGFSSTEIPNLSNLPTEGGDFSNESFSLTPRLIRLTYPFMEGEDVREVQTALVKVSLLSDSEIDGIYGPITEVAVIKFQEERGLAPDGIVGEKTRQELGLQVSSEDDDPMTETVPPVSGGRQGRALSERWWNALAKAPTTGASATTARQDGLPPGVASSHKMAQTDLSRVLAIAANFRTVGAKFDVPPALIAALASRESRAGSVLDANGFGDRGNAFGILQVDRRFHTLQGTDSPISMAHIEQAVGIFNDYRDQVQRNHPTWEDEFILKGAVVAYNSGVSNVQTKNGLDIGTTGNDYGSDVIARAQFYATKPELA